MKMLIFLLILSFYVKCDFVDAWDSGSDIHVPIQPPANHIIINVTENGTLIAKLISAATLYFNNRADNTDIKITNIFLLILMILILIILFITICICCLLLIFGCMRFRSSKKIDVEKANHPITIQQPQQRISLPPQQQSNQQPQSPPILQRQVEVPKTPLNLPPPEMLLTTKNVESPNKGQKPKSDKQPMAQITIDAQQRPESSLSSSPSPVSSASTSKSKTPRQAKTNKKIIDKQVQTDLDTSDEELQDKIRGNETMPGRSTPLPRKELLV